jgi:catechol 2,3-dioxygenase-like lactoylglutathione lyase family enzyme
MAVLRPHLALTVSELERSISFYEALFGVEPAKVRPGYAKFELASPALNFTLNEGRRGDGLGALNHAGVQVSSTEDVLAARERLTDAGLAAFDEMDTTCCYARQDKIWVHDPDGTPWEVFAVTQDDPVESTGDAAETTAGSAGDALETAACCAPGDTVSAPAGCCGQPVGQA